MPIRSLPPYNSYAYSKVPRGPTLFVVQKSGQLGKCAALSHTCDKLGDIATTVPGWGATPSPVTGQRTYPLSHNDHEYPDRELSATMSVLLILTNSEPESPRSASSYLRRQCRIPHIHMGSARPRRTPHARRPTERQRSNRAAQGESAKAPFALGSLEVS